MRAPPSESGECNKVVTYLDVDCPNMDMTSVHKTDMPMWLVIGVVCGSYTNLFRAKVWRSMPSRDLRVDV